MFASPSSQRQQGEDEATAESDGGSDAWRLLANNNPAMPHFWQLFAG
jgi:hypothetical protein